MSGVDYYRELLIDVLLDAKSKGWASASGSKLIHSAAGMIQEACDYRVELNKKSHDELQALYAPIERECKQREGVESQQREACARDERYSQWARKSYWQKVEAVLLICDFDPKKGLTRKFSHLSEPLVYSSAVSDDSRVWEIDDLLERSISVKEISREAPPALFMAWCAKKNIVAPGGLLDAVAKFHPPKPPESIALPESHSLDAADDDTLVLTPIKGSLLERRIQVIRVALAAKGWDPMCVEDKGKKEIMALCIATLPELFSKSTFPKAWQTAVTNKVVRMKKHDDYAKR